MVGGAQAINGAVFKPGAPEDLARSLGISVAEAKEVQRLSASYVTAAAAARQHQRDDVGVH